MVSTNNMQVLGWAEGINPADATRKFKNEYSILLKGYGDFVILYELKETQGIPAFIN